MIDSFIDNFPISKLHEDANKMVPDSESYFATYQEFIQYFKNLKEITRHNTIIGISFTYSWMPTILDFQSSEIENATDILNSAKNGCRPGLSDLAVLKKCFNNSLVGSSKLLHFVNPEVFAIWDSRVYRYLTQKIPHSYRVENANTYLDYLFFCDYIINDSDFDDVHKIVERKVGYKLTKMRALELVCFYGGAKSHVLAEEISPL